MDHIASNSELFKDIIMIFITRFVLSPSDEFILGGEMGRRMFQYIYIYPFSIVLKYEKFIPLWYFCLSHAGPVNSKFQIMLIFSSSKPSELLFYLYKKPRDILLAIRLVATSGG